VEPMSIAPLRRGGAAATGSGGHGQDRTRWVIVKWMLDHLLGRAYT
jgi:hypothetical protein